jgi:hypothetical protein
MKKALFSILFFFSIVIFNGCAIVNFGDTIDLNDNTAYLTIQLDEGSKGSASVQIIDIKTAIFKLTDPSGGVQSNTWVPGSNTVILFHSFKQGIHTLQLTDIDTNNMTNSTNASLNLKLGYNYRILAVVGGAIGIYEVTNTNTFVFNPSLALVLYSETHAQNVVWGTDINTNEGPSDPNILTFTNQTAGEGTQCFKIKVNSNMFDVNWLRYPLVTYLDLTAYTNGSLRFMIKATKYISVSIHTAENYDIMVHLPNEGMYGFTTNNTWCNVIIPMSAYVAKGLTFTSLYGYLKFYGGYYEGIVGGEEYYIDDVYFYKQ